MMTIRNEQKHDSRSKRVALNLGRWFGLEEKTQRYLLLALVALVLTIIIVPTG